MKKHELYQYLIVTLVAFLSAIPWLGYMAGDSVIHLIFAEHAAAGNWFVFNNLTPSGGESSPLYLIFVTALYKLTGPQIIPYILIACGVSAWVGTSLLTRKVALRLGITPILSTACAIAVAAMPGSVRNSVLGMENVYLALGLLIFLNLSIKLNWLTKPQTARTEALLGLLLAALACLRTEATILIALLAAYRLFLFWQKGQKQPINYLISFTSPAIAAALFLLQLGWYYHATNGQLPFSGGLARQALAAQEAWFTLAGLPFNGKILERLAAYFPLTIPALAGAFIAWKHPAKQPAFRALTLIVAVMIPLFATILPSGHLGRYTIFLWPLIAILAAYGWQTLLAPNLPRARLLGMGLFALLMAIYMAENILRFKTLAPGHTLASIAQAPANRTAFTTAQLAEWGFNPRPTPINVAVNEVQMRYFYDNRITILSLDGIVDSSLRNYIHHGVYDHVSYLSDKNANILLEFPNFNADKQAWALSNLRDLPQGEYLAKKDLVFSKLPSGVVRIERQQPDDLD